MRIEPPRPTDDHEPTSVVVYDIETISDAPMPDGGFPPWPTHRSVAASFLTAIGRQGQYSFEWRTIICTPGEERCFYEQVEERLASAVTKVTYNGRGFDAGVLRLGSMAQRMFSLPRLADHAHAQRFGRFHADLADLYSTYGATRRVGLAELCQALGIPAKTSTCGGDVQQLWAEGQIDRIRAYVEEDVAATYLLWLNWVAFRNSDPALIAQPLAAFVRLIEATPDYAHLKPFATSALADWARPQALHADVATALAEAEHLVRVEADERAFAASVKHKPF